MHKWFQNINWNSIEKREQRPPFVPLIKDELDLSNFENVNL